MTNNSNQNMSGSISADPTLDPANIPIPGANADDEDLIDYSDIEENPAEADDSRPEPADEMTGVETGAVDVAEVVPAGEAGVEARESQTAARKAPGPKCFRCWKRGHIARDCVSVRPAKAAKSSPEKGKTKGEGKSKPKPKIKEEKGKGKGKGKKFGGRSSCGPRGPKKAGGGPSKKDDEDLGKKILLVGRGLAAAVDELLKRG